jgi:type II secretory pathway pseudopilin PulG
MNRRAFTLVEMLLLIAAAPFIMVIVSGIFATIIRDIPRETRVVQQHTTALDMLRQLRRDVDAAVGLPDESQEIRADERTLLIAQSDAVIRYQFDSGRVVRTLLNDPNEQRVWRMRDAVVTWRPWVRGGAAHAVEVHSHVQQQVAHLRRNQLANSHVFFLHGIGKGCRTQ